MSEFMTTRIFNINDPRIETPTALLRWNNGVLQQTWSVTWLGSTTLEWRDVPSAGEGGEQNGKV